MTETENLREALEPSECFCAAAEQFVPTCPMHGNTLSTSPASSDHADCGCGADHVDGCWNGPDASPASSLPPPPEQGGVIQGDAFTVARTVLEAARLSPASSPPEQGEVTQADRDAAADLLAGGWQFDTLWHPQIRDGERDDHVIVQAFARHRRAALATPSSSPPGHTDLMIAPENIPDDLGKGDPLVDPDAVVTAEEGVPCKGCGAKTDSERCIGCFHDFGTPESAWARKRLAPVVTAEDGEEEEDGDEDHNPDGFQHASPEMERVIAEAAREYLATPSSSPVVTAEPRCPFCGAGDPVVHPLPGPGLHALRDGRPYFSHCDGCGADGPCADTVEEAEALWRRREPVITAPLKADEEAALHSALLSSVKVRGPVVTEPGLVERLREHKPDCATMWADGDCDCATERLEEALAALAPSTPVVNEDSDQEDKQ